MVDYHNSESQDIVGDIGNSLQKLVSTQWLIIGTIIINIFVLITGSFLNSIELFELIFSILVFFLIAMSLFVILKSIREIQLLINLKKCSDVSDDKNAKKLFIFWLVTVILGTISTIIGEYFIPFSNSSIFIILGYKSLVALPFAIMNIITVFTFISWIQPLLPLMKNEYSKN